MIIKLPEKIKLIFSRLSEAGYDGYCVGGCVRDSLLGKTPKDWDVATDALPENVCGLFESVIKTGIRHGSVTVMLGGEPFELTTYRVDGKYSDFRRPENVSFSSELTEDLGRRDFTVNAMAYSLKTGIIDLFNGIGDLKDKIIRCVGNPAERFSEDALRMLRAIRFAAQLDFTVESGTLAAIKEKAQLIEHISGERIFAEFRDIMTSAHPAKLTLLYETDLISHIAPEIAPHLNESAVTLPDLENDFCLRMAAILLNADQPGAILKRLKFPKVEAVRILDIVGHFNIEVSPNEASVRKSAFETGIDNLRDIMKIRISRCPQNYVTVQIARTLEKIVSKGCCLTTAALELNGGDLVALGYEPGPLIGAILTDLIETVVAKPEMNRREILISYVKKKYLI